MSNQPIQIGDIDVLASGVKLVSITEDDQQHIPASAWSICFSTAELCRHISTYCDSIDLLRLESMNKIWQEIVLYHFHLLRNLPHIKPLTFKTHSLWSTDKRICSRISNLQRRKDSYMYLFGGSFHTPIRKSCKLPDSTALWDSEPTGVDLPPHLSASASTTDQHGNFLVIGGFNDLASTAVDEVRHFDMRNPNRGWNEIGSLPRPRCYGAAVTTISGDILHTGGGSSPYQGGSCYSDVYVRKAGEYDWEECIVPNMNKVRCGHSAVTMYNDNIFVTGGYAGGTTFHSSVEMFDAGANRWINLPDMSVARSGMFATLGPGGAVFVTGGSPDGVSGHKSTERYDPREGKWQALCDLNIPRGYTTGCMSIQNSGFYVIGGIDNFNYSGTMEFYDFRANTWSVVEAANGKSHWLGRATALMVNNL